MTRHAFVNLNKRWIFFWSPKAGNSSLARWLVSTVDNKDGIRDTLLRSHEPRGVLRLVHGCDDPELLGHLARDLGFKSYVLARNPALRATSAFIEKFVYRNRPLTDPNSLKHFARHYYEETVSERGTYRGLSFIEFLTGIVAKTTLARSKGQDPPLDPHWNTQVPLHFDNLKFRYDHILRLESINEDSKLVGRELNIKSAFPRERVQYRPGNDALGDLSEVKSAVLASDGIVPKSSSLLSPKAKTLINQAYEVDFRILGYQPF